MNFLSKLFNQKKMKSESIIRYWLHDMVHVMEKDAIQFEDFRFPFINRQNTFIQIIRDLNVFAESDVRIAKLKIDHDALLFELGTFNIWFLIQWLDDYLPNESSEFIIQPFVSDFLALFSRVLREGGTLNEIFNQRIKLYDDLMNSASAKKSANTKTVISAIAKLISITKGKELIDNFHFTDTNDNKTIESLIKLYISISMPNVGFQQYCDKFYKGYVYLDELY